MLVPIVVKMKQKPGTMENYNKPSSIYVSVDEWKRLIKSTIGPFDR